MDVKLNWPQARIHQAFKPGMTVCTPWGRGVGKSHYVLLQECLLVAQYDGTVRNHQLGRQRGIRSVLMLPTFKQAKDLYAAKIEEWLSPGGDWGWLGAKIDRTTWKTSFPGGSTFQLFGAENAHASRGLRMDCVALDESDDIDTAIFDGVVAPWLSEPWSLKLRLISGTPRRGHNGLLYRTHARGTEAGSDARPDFFKYRADHLSVHATGYDTPDTVDRDFLDRMREETPPDTFKREYLCDFDSGEALVYDLFRPSFHIRKAPAKTYCREILIGVDHGYNDPAVFLVLGVTGNGHDSVVHIMEEFYETKRTAPELLTKAKALKAKYPNARWFADPSRPDAIEEYRRNGIRIVGANNAVEDGIAAVASKLHIRKTVDGAEFAQLFVDPACKNTIREFGLYRRKRDPRNADRVLDEVMDRDDHAMDSARYAILSYFGSPGAERHTWGDGN